MLMIKHHHRPDQLPELFDKAITSYRHHLDAAGDAGMLSNRFALRLTGWKTSPSSGGQSSED
ncbi:hypothetical protein [Pseudonocardia nigra]|uniref:hypothetical protein n=1 Tax=Pseudonocardia nigra TaxID=1921578 RepID=UPI001C5E7A19|nr:hypothetical protein [Pseudonocardia nigra]